MLMMRLQRIGRRNEAHFKIVVIEKTKGPKSQKYVDIIGSYNPKMGTVQMNEEKAKKHLTNGVQPSDTVYNMLVTKGLIEGRKRNNLPQKSPVIDEEKIAAEKAAAEAKLAKAAEEKAAAEAKAAEDKAAAEAKAAEPEVTEEAPAEEVAEVAAEPEVTEEAPAEEVAEVTEEVATPVVASSEKDDLKKIEGIGPKIESVLNEKGITTFAQLAAAKDEDTQAMIAEVRGNHKADSWNEQAELARDGKWDELKTLQDALDGGVVK